MQFPVGEQRAGGLEHRAIAAADVEQATFGGQKGAALFERVPGAGAGRETFWKNHLFVALGQMMRGVMAIDVGDGGERGGVVVFLEMTAARAELDDGGELAGPRIRGD